MSRLLGFKIILGGLLSLFSHAYSAAQPAPEVIAPASKVKVSPNSDVEYQWQHLEGATEYDFLIRDVRQKQVLHRVTLQAEQYCAEQQCNYSAPESAILSNFGRYVWKVRVLNRPYRTKFSRSLLFVSGEAPDKPILTAPIKNAEFESPSAPTYQWLHAEGSAHYIFRIVDKKNKVVIYRNANVPVSSCDAEGVCTYELGETLDLAPGEYRWTVRASNGHDRSRVARSTFLVKVAVPLGVLSEGYDWQLPDYASENNYGGLVRDTWADKKAYTNTVFYGLRWDQVPLNQGPLSEASYDFGSFDWWLNHGGGKDEKVLVRLDVNSVCDTPAAFFDEFNYYAGGSIAFWQQSYLDRLRKFVSDFAAAYAGNPRIVGVHLGIADGEYSFIENDNYEGVCDPKDFYTGDDGWGEFWVDENQLSHAMSIDNGLTAENFQSSVREIIETYTQSFGDHTPKLAMTNLENFVYNDSNLSIVDDETINVFNQLKTNDITPYALGEGVGNRDGLIEDWMAYNNPVYGIGFKPGPDRACYMTMDESFAENLANRYWGTENEEYGNYSWVINKHGDYDKQPYRFMMSSLRALQMRRNHMQINTEAMESLTQPETAPDSDYNTEAFLNYLAATLGRNKSDTPDAFAVLGERYVRTQYINGYSDEEFESAEFESCLIADGKETPSYAKIRGYGRWLTEVGGQGSKSKLVPLNKGVEPWSIPAFLPEVDGSTKYEYAARDSHELKFDINDALISSRCDTELGCEFAVKVVFEDSKATVLSLVTDAGVVGRVTTLGDGATKTATFDLNGVLANAYDGADFAIKTEKPEESLPVFMVRVNLQNP